MIRVKVDKDLLKIKDLVGKPRRNFNEKKEFGTQLKELGYRISEIERKTEKKGFDLKKVKEIIYILQNRELTSSDMGKILNISRNRANEYLKKMKLENILKSRSKGKKKFYSAINQPSTGDKTFSGFSASQKRDTIQKTSVLQSGKNSSTIKKQNTSYPPIKNEHD